MTNIETLNDNLKQLLEEYFIISKETVTKLKEVEELSIGFKTDGNIENIGKLKKAAFIYNLYNLAMIKNIAKIKVTYTLCKLLKSEFDFVLDGSPEGVPVGIEEVVQKIIESDPDLVGVVSGQMVILDESLEDAINNRMENISTEELAQLMSKRDEETK